MEALKFVTTNLQEMLGFNSALFTSSEGSVGGRKERVEFVAWEVSRIILDWFRV